MLRINRSEEQGLRLTMRLARHDQVATLATLAQQEALPEPTVAKLLGKLRAAGVVKAIRGRNGGYSLADRPEQISSARVLHAVGSKPDLQSQCNERRNKQPACPHHSNCGLRSVWRHLQNGVTSLFESTSIADLLQAESTVDRQLASHWPQRKEAPSDTPAPLPVDKRVVQKTNQGVE